MAPEYFRQQNYWKLRKQHQKSGSLFMDPEFPSTQSSLFADPNKNIAGGDIEWKRPGDIVGCPRLVEGGASVNDVTQGLLGNCWFVTACSVLTRHKSLFEKVIPNPTDQEWDDTRKEKYCGIFHFCFYRFGKWVDVVIDDLLPTQNGKLIFARSRTRNEFWSALLEKAFAK